MTMGKSLLLGTAAGFVTIAGAQAADLPVKAKPVEYVKICSLYGVGFYYIPGTDMCIKIGGWVRAEYGWGNNGNFTWGWANGNVNNRTTNNSDFRARGYNGCSHGCVNVRDKNKLAWIYNRMKVGDKVLVYNA